MRRLLHKVLEHPLLLVLAMVLSCGCGGQREQAHGLNETALDYLWISLDSSSHYAALALDCAGADRTEKAQALNTLARVAFMGMDYGSAWDLYGQVLDSHPGISMQITANIGLMRICQRTSDNLAFYEYRNRILLLLRTMHDEESRLSAQDLGKLESLERSFRMESAMYYHDLGQTAQADDEMQSVSQDSGLRQDTDRWLMYLYLQGLGIGLEPERSGMQERLYCLEQCMKQAEKCGNRRMETVSAVALSSLILETEGDIQKAMDLASRSLDVARDYHGGYETVQALCQMARCQISAEQYKDALFDLNEALEIAERASGTGIWDYAVPECVASIHEIMSVAWSGLDNADESDLHRDIYLEIQKTIRLDRRYEARRVLLEQSNHRLSGLILGIGIAILLLAVIYILVLRRVRKSNLNYARLMEQSVDLCRTILQPVPAEELQDRMDAVVAPRLCSLTGAANVTVTAPGRVDVDWGGHRPNRDSRAVVETVSPFLEQAYANSQLLLWQSDTIEQARKQHYLYLVHRAESKRGNLVRKTCCQVVAQCLPWIDRMKSQIERLSGLEPGTPEYEQGMDYVSELASMINRYNDILAGWIGIRQGLVTLNISSFPIQELLNIVGQGTSAFRNKGVELSVLPSDAVVRADRVLTLFMINTLADNARKFTPQGGKVTVQVQEETEYVEISVSDTGIGLSESDVQRINHDKVLDSGSIGDAGTEHGSGFGLMNCKGIIDKYVKSHPMFSVCRFHVDSVKGKGSRFSFRLPKGVRKALSILLLMLSVTLPADAQENPDSLLALAYDYAYNAYSLNVDGDSRAALEQARLAFDMLNADYLEHGGQGRMLALWDSLPAAELQWIEERHATDYETVLWIRNEVAVSALALKDWNLYHYNDEAYLKLFKQYFSDSLVEQDCAELQHSNSNLSIAFILFVLVLVTAFLVLFAVYARHWIRHRSDLKQMLGIMDSIRRSLDTVSVENFDVGNTLQTMCDSIFPDMDSLFGLDGLGIGLPDGERVIHVVSGKPGAASDCVTVPMVNGPDQPETGTLEMWLKGDDIQNRQVLDMITGYLAAAMPSMLLRFESGFNDLNQLSEESARMKMEQERLHINNMVLDNCLSTLKHETVWYPNRIMQLAAARDRTDMPELVSYYRNVFGILSHQVLDETRIPLVQRSSVSSRSIVDDVLRTMSRKYPSLQFECDGPDLAVEADEELVRFLLENLVSRSMELGCQGPVSVSIAADGDFVRFALFCPGIHPATDTLFSPLGNPDSMAFVLCSQIIREHDESFGHIGCRINAESRQGGTLLWFTLPNAERI